MSVTTNLNCMQISLQNFKVKQSFPFTGEIPPEGLDTERQLVCAMNYPYVYGRNDNGTIRLLCPHACGKCNYPLGSAWCSSSDTVYVGKVKLKDDPRLITAPFRGTLAFKKLYN